MVARKASDPSEGKSGKDKSSKSTGRRTYAFDLNDLIIHNYAERDLLLKKADKIAQDIIAQNLRPGETVSKPKSGHYLFSFPNLTPEAGDLRCAVLAEQVAREVRTLNPTYVKLDAALHGAHPPPSNHDVREALREHQHERIAREAANRAFARMGDAKVGPSERVELSAADKKILSSFRAQFSPVWHARKNMITAYNCALVHEGHALRSSDLHSLFGDDDLAVAWAKADAALCQVAVKAAIFLTQKSLQALLIIPLQFSTVDRLRFIPTLLQAVGHVPDEIRGMMVFELRDVPRNISRFRLREPVHYLRTRARALLAHPDFEVEDLELFKALGFHGVCVDLRRYDWKEERILARFDTFVADTEKHGLKSFVHGIRSKSLASAAIAAGFNYIEGPAVAAPVHNPQSIKPYEIDMLYEDHP